MKSLTTLLLSSFLLLSFKSTAQQTAQTTSPKPKVVNSKSAQTHQTRSVAKAPKIKFAKDKIDFGTIKEDSIVEKSFEFTNIGSADLIITGATGSCGCTIPTYPIFPIAPGEKGTIMVKYTAKNKFGPQKPTISVMTNAYPRLVKVQLEGWVEQIPGGVKEKS